MVKHRQKKSPVGLPTLKGVLSGSIEGQIATYKKCKLQLDHNARRSLRRNKRALLPMKDVQQYVEAIEAYWEEQRRLCQSNPDYFEWPDTKIWFGDGHLHVDNWEKVGALKLFGYAVSSDYDLSEPERRRILDVVFSATIPPFASWAHVQQWSEPESANRLFKMANCLASFARNGQHMRKSYMDRPVKRWVSDLRYLRERYYRDRFHFDWPDSSIL